MVGVVATRKGEVLEGDFREVGVSVCAVGLTAIVVTRTRKARTTREGNGLYDADYNG